jgi:hypothetical protein
MTNPFPVGAHSIISLNSSFFMIKIKCLPVGFEKYFLKKQKGFFYAIDWT